MRLYRVLLRLYPASFRGEYGEELCDAFAERTRGLFGPLAILLAALTDVIPNAIAAHWEILRQDLSYAARSLRRTPGFTLALAFVILTGLAFGLAPAIRAGRSSALDALSSGVRTAGGRTQRFRSTLVIIEVAASVVAVTLCLATAVVGCLRPALRPALRAGRVDPLSALRAE